MKKSKIHKNENCQKRSVKPISEKRNTKIRENLFFPNRVSIEFFNIIILIQI